MLKNSSFVRMARIILLAALLIPTGIWARSLELVATYDTPSFPVQTIVNGNIAYIADYPALLILDISDPIHPVMLGSYDANLGIYRIAIKDTLALLATGTSEPYMGIFEVVSIADPANIYSLDTLRYSWEVFDVVTKGDYAYVTIYGSSHVIDISNPTNIVDLGVFDTGGSLLHFTVDDYLYAANGAAGISLLDLSNPQLPVIIGSCGTPSAAFEIAINSPTPNLIYVADIDSGLQAIDIANPNNPTWVTRFGFNTSIRTLAIDGTVAYAAGDSGLFAVDISEPDDLVLIDSYGIMNHPWDIECANGLIFVSEIQRVDVFRLVPDIIEYPYIPGDINGNGNANGIDVTYAVSFFKGGSVPPYRILCPGHDSLYAAGDVNGNCLFNGVDITYMVRAYMLGRPLRWCVDCPPISGLRHEEIRGECQPDIALDDSSYMVLEAIGNDLHIHHMDVIHQCCLEYNVEYFMRNYYITAMERDTGPLCDCICPFDLESVVYDLNPAMYYVTLINFDNEIVGVDSAYVGGR